MSKFTGYAWLHGDVWRGKVAYKSRIAVMCNDYPTEEAAYCAVGGHIDTLDDYEPSYLVISADNHNGFGYTMVSDFGVAIGVVSYLMSVASVGVTGSQKLVVNTLTPLSIQNTGALVEAGRVLRYENGILLTGIKWKILKVRDGN